MLEDNYGSSDWRWLLLQRRRPLGLYSALEQGENRALELGARREIGRSHGVARHEPVDHPRVDVGAPCDRRGVPDELGDLRDRGANSEMISFC